MHAAHVGTSRISRTTPEHIIAVGQLILAVACSTGAILGLILGALHLCPISLISDLFRSCALGLVSASCCPIFHRRSSRRNP